MSLHGRSENLPDVVGRNRRVERISLSPERKVVIDCFPVVVIEGLRVVDDPRLYMGIFGVDGDTSCRPSKCVCLLLVDANLNCINEASSEGDLLLSFLANATAGERACVRRLAAERYGRLDEEITIYWERLTRRIVAILCVFPCSSLFAAEVDVAASRQFLSRMPAIEPPHSADIRLP